MMSIQFIIIRRVRASSSMLCNWRSIGNEECSANRHDGTTRPTKKKRFRKFIMHTVPAILILSLLALCCCFGVEKCVVWSLVPSSYEWISLKDERLSKRRKWRIFSCFAAWIRRATSSSRLVCTNNCSIWRRIRARSLNRTMRWMWK